MKNFFRIILIFVCCVPLAGCLLSNGNEEQAASSLSNQYAGHIKAIGDRLSEIQIGMKESSVILIIGNPSGNNITRTASVKSEQLVYDAEQLAGNVEGYSARERFSELVDIFHLPNPKYYLYFDNGILTSTQGF